MKPEPSKIRNLTGMIIHKEPYKVYSKNSPYLGNQCYKLQIVVIKEKDSQQREKETLFIYPNLVRKEIFSTIEQIQYLDKRYLFFCEKKAKGWVLHDWKELTNTSENHDQKN